MPDHSSNRLVHRSLSLQLVPLLAVHASKSSPIPLVQVLLLDQDLGIEHLRIRNASHDDTAGSIIGKVNAFSQLPPTHGEARGFPLLLNALQVLLEHKGILLLVLVLNENFALL
jgi:hypothetical protein